MIDQELEQTAGDLFSAQQRLQALTASRKSLQVWLEESTGLPAGQPLLPAERWQVFSAAASLALDDPVWRAILASQPSADAHPDTYWSWVAQVLGQIDLEIGVLPGRITTLEAQRDALKDKYSLESANSLSLSPNIEIQEVGPVITQVIRPTTTLILVGGVIGLLGWLLIELIRITRRAQARD
jgi:hypothetical protein